MLRTHKTPTLPISLLILRKKPTVLQSSVNKEAEILSTDAHQVLNVVYTVLQAQRFSKPPFGDLKLYNGCQT